MRGHKSNPIKGMRPDIEQYGWDVIKVCVVQSGMLQEDASKLERRTTSSFMATVPAWGYNILEGAPMRWKLQGRKKKR
eukprot:1159108-Pelagomonas_calceolata.AAC.2